MEIQIAAAAARTVAYQRRLNRTSSVGLNTNAQKVGDIATAVTAAISGSGRCFAAISWGSAKKTDRY